MTPAAAPAAAPPSLEDETDASAAAASVLFERHRTRVHAFCRGRTRNATDAEDATQTTFMYALTALKRGVVPEFELGWLLRIAENVCHSMRRRAHRRYERDALPAEVPADPFGDPAVVSERTATLSSALESLPESQRRALVLREWRGLSYDDIAAELRTSHAAVETLLFRARRSIAKRVASAAPLGLHLPSGARVLRWLLGTGTGKAAAVTAAAITVGAAGSAGGPVRSVGALSSFAPVSPVVVAERSDAPPVNVPAPRLAKPRAGVTPGAPGTPTAAATPDVHPEERTPAAAPAAPPAPVGAESDEGGSATVVDVHATADDLAATVEPVVAAVQELKPELLLPLPLPEVELELPPIEVAPVLAPPSLP